MKGHYLEGHVFKSIAVREERTCDVKCYIEESCVSYNIVSTPKDGTMICELSYSDHEMHPEDLKRRFGSIYQSFEVSFLKLKTISNFLLTIAMKRTWPGCKKHFRKSGSFLKSFPAFPRILSLLHVPFFN